MERPRPAPGPDQRSSQAGMETALSVRCHASDELPPPPVYNTGMGSLTFEQLYHKTSRIVGSVMRGVYGMTNPEDIDDCMQAGYLKVWQHLQQDPDYFVDKPKRYIVQAVVFRSKAQRFSHQRHYHKMNYDAKAEQQRSIAMLTTGQVDTWIDLAHALATVAQQVENTPVALLGLYCLITQATVQDVAATFGCGYSTLTKKKREARARLAALLDGYGPGPENGTRHDAAALPFTARPAGLVTKHLLEAVHTPVERVIYHAEAASPAHRTVIINGQEPPPPRDIPSPAYPTRWGGSMTLEQIITDPQVHRAAFAKARTLGLNDFDQEDCVQQGFIRLWQILQDDPQLLADKGPIWAGIYVAYQGNPKQFHRHAVRQRIFDVQTWDERVVQAIGSRRASGIQRTHADWAAEADENIDVSRFIHTMNQRYASDPRRQIAFQAVTGAMSSQMAARQLGIHPRNFAATVGNVVRREAQSLLAENDPRAEPWESRLARGEGLEHITRIAQDVMHNQRLLLALYVVTTGASRKVVAETFGYGLTAFGKDIRRIRQMLAHRYRRERIDQK